MKFINRAFVMALLVMPQAVWAVTPANIETVPSTSTSAATERGGTITAVNRRERTITVDGVTYLLASGVGEDLRKNMQVIFSTVKSGYGGQETISTIQAVNIGK